MTLIFASSKQSFMDAFIIFKYWVYNRLMTFKKAYLRILFCSFYIFGSVNKFLCQDQ